MINIGELSGNTLVATLVGAAIGFFASLFTVWRTNRVVRQVAMAQLLLDFDRRLDEFKDVHVAVRGGIGIEASLDKELFMINEVEAYMGCFERLDTFLERKLIDKAYIEDFYKYRASNLVNDTWIRKYKLCNSGVASGWKRFIHLCREMDIKIQC
jgi:hypothetical protein